jgi:8-amino-7-oxononanoate synthase
MNVSPIYDRVERKLDEQRNRELFRTTRPFKSSDEIDLSTNSYLALHANADVIAMAKTLINDNIHGNLASRLIAETSGLYSTIESEIASWEKTESSLLFTSGYAANVGVIQALCTKDTEIYCDRLNHASIYDGIALSGAKLVRYKHCDMTDLEQKLAVSENKERLIITDTIFSMDGDRAPLENIAELAKKYNCMVMIDEAHATGIFGRTASGLAEECGVEDSIDIRIGTLSKAIGGQGGYFAGSTRLRDYFVNFSRSFIYSTGLAHSSLAYSLAAIRYIRRNLSVGRNLIDRAEAFRHKINKTGISTLTSTTQIIPCLTETKARALHLSAFLSERGIYAPAIRPPTVPDGSARIRISYHAGLTEENEKFIIEQLSAWKKSHG